MINVYYLHLLFFLLARKVLRKMKTLSRRFKKHVINNSNQTLENKQDDIHQIATSFKPIHSPKAQNFITQNSYPPVGTPPSQCNNVDSDSKETDLVAESLRRR